MLLHVQLRTKLQLCCSCRSTQGQGQGQSTVTLYESLCRRHKTMNKMKGGVIVLAGVAGLLGVDGAITPTTDHNMNGDVYLLAPTPGQSSPANWSTRYPLSLSSFLLLFSS